MSNTGLCDLHSDSKPLGCTVSLFEAAVAQALRLAGEETEAQEGGWGLPQWRN